MKPTVFPILNRSEVALFALSTMARALLFCLSYDSSGIFISIGPVNRFLGSVYSYKLSGNCYQVKGMGYAEVGSIGIGLSSTKRPVELHGEIIWAESEGEGKGTTFSFCIPL